MNAFHKKIIADAFVNPL